VGPPMVVMSRSSKEGARHEKKAPRPKAWAPFSIAACAG
jgi:hypothetical protein